MSCLHKMLHNAITNYYAEKEKREMENCTKCKKPTILYSTNATECCVCVAMPVAYDYENTWRHPIQLITGDSTLVVVCREGKSYTCTSRKGKIKYRFSKTRKLYIRSCKL